jgi:anti-sigma factor (TIGR02949 family)
MQHLNIETLIDYLHHELAPGQDASVLAHLEECRDCASELNVEAAITERLRATARTEDLDLPVGMRSAIMARIAALRPTPLDVVRRWLGPIVLVPVAASIAAAAFFLAPHPTTQNQQAALPVSYYLEAHAVGAQGNPLADRGTVMLPAMLTQDGAR